MNDADAESILAALGASLPWEEYGGQDLTGVPDGVKDYMKSAKKKTLSRRIVALIAWLEEAKNTIKFAETSSGTYSIRVRRKLWLKRGYTVGFYVKSPLQFGSHSETFKYILDAKAACERHYATGKWE